MGKFIDLTDLVFGKWKVIRRLKKTIGKTHWLCECTCGQSSLVASSHLLGGKSTQCKRCHGIEAVRKRPLKHGSARRGLLDREYSSWSSMRTRCLNPNNEHWEGYGKRGIKVCPEWEEFCVFKKDMGACPDGHTLDRIDSSGNYCRENCRWATHQQQCENKRSNVMLELNGTFKTKTQWASLYKMPYTSFNRLIKKIGWPLPEPPK